jgi:probable phosphoglycerate mutase
VRYTWIPRAQNGHADRLANEAMDAAAQGRSWTAKGSPVPAPAPAAVEAGPSTAAVRASVPARSGEPTTLLLARHGRTADTERGVFTGRGGADLPLSPAGEADADRLAALLAALGTASSPIPGVDRVDAVVASPMLRASGTAAVAADRLGLDTTVDEGWAEMAFGAWEGCSYADLARRDPDALAAWWGKPEVPPPGGESFDDLAARVRSARQRVVAAHPGQVVAVVSHGGPVRVVVRDALDGGPATLWRLRVTPAAVTAVRYWDDGGVEVVTVNATPSLPGA